MAKTKEKQLAVRLREAGKTYSEILKEVSVVKSTLSLWLREVGLAKKQQQRITQKRIDAQQRGAVRKREMRKALEKRIRAMAAKEINRISKRDLWMIGIALYWAEGARQKENNVSASVRLSNSDPRMVKLFILWLRKLCDIDVEDINVTLYIHRKTGDEIKAKEFWSRVTGIPPREFKKTVWKKHKILTNRRLNHNYHGLIAIQVSRSTNLNRKIAGWIDGIYKNYSGVV